MCNIFIECAYSLYYSANILYKILISWAHIGIYNTRIGDGQDYVIRVYAHLINIISQRNIWNVSISLYFEIYFRAVFFIQLET